MGRTKKEIRERQRGLAKAAERFQSWRPAAQVLTRVRAIPTVLVQLDRATRVGGWPIERFGLVHGPSNMGKTSFCLALGRSFLAAGGLFGFMDAEHATPLDWAVKMLGPSSSSPGFVAKRPKSYEDAVDSVRDFIDAIMAAREAGEISEETTGLVVVDSVRKLVPDKLMEKIIKHGASSKKGSVDGYGGRAAMMKAALNAQWLDELIPLLYHTKTALVFVARETEAPDAGPFERDWKVGGGRAPFFEASLVCRVCRAGWVRQGSGESAKLIGERHRVDIHKTKVGRKDDKVVQFYFHTSNGAFVPEGLDQARDVVDLGLELGALSKKDRKIERGTTGEVWSSVNELVRTATSERRLLADLELEVRAMFEEGP